MWSVERYDTHERVLYLLEDVQVDLQFLQFSSLANLSIPHEPVWYVRQSVRIRPCYPWQRL